MLNLAAYVVTETAYHVSRELYMFTKFRVTYALDKQALKLYTRLSDKERALAHKILPF